jgi:hypothetical protein
MATSTPATPAARKRIKLVKFAVPDAASIEKLVTDGKLRRVDIPAKDAKVTESGKTRKAQPARVQFLSDNRAGTLALFGGNEKAVNLAASLYWETYIKRMNSKGKTADPLRAINRTSDAFSKFSAEELEKLGPEGIAAIETLRKLAAANPVAPAKRKTKAAKTATK